MVHLLYMCLLTIEVLSNCRPYVWGLKCQEHCAMKKLLGTSLKEPSMEEVLDLLDRNLLLKSMTDFPLNRSLKVNFLLASQ